MGAWLKLFADGTIERGSDEEIARGKASWSRGRLNKISEVRLFNKRQVVSLSVPNTSWHQFDRFIVAVEAGRQTPQITHRVIQAEIKPHHLGQLLVSSKTGVNSFWAIVKDVKDTKKDDFFYKPITEKHIGKWLTVILPERDYPAITFSTRGKMNDNQHIPRQRN